ncbi:MAG: nitroreductase family protein [Promethearchaeia archaeon]
MSYSKSIKEIIRARKSWRTYLEESIEEETRKRLLDFVDKLGNSPFGNSKVRFKFMSLEDSAEINRFATYGMIKGAPYYLLGAVERFKHAYEHYGYLFEKIILKATDLNLGTCWLGGTFDRKKVSKAIDLNKNEIIPAVTPIGYVESRRFMGKAVRWLIRAKKRKEWKEIFYRKKGNSLIPLDKEKAERYKKGLEMVRIGPSAKNRQPWRIVKAEKKNIFHFYRADSASYSRLDISIAVCHFHLTCKEERLNGRWNIKEPPRLKSVIPENWKYSITWQEKL